MFYRGLEVIYGNESLKLQSSECGSRIMEQRRRNLLCQAPDELWEVYTASIQDREL